jgi:hypothetical protein
VRLYLALLAVGALVGAACFGADPARPGPLATREPSPPGGQPGLEPTSTSTASFPTFLSNYWKTDFDKRSISPTEVISGGPGKDGIPAIDTPRFVPVSEGSFLGEKEPVVSLVIAGDARAYPLQILIWHEIVNDTVGGTPVSVTFCPLCNSAVVFDRRLDGRILDFGVSGFLRHSDLIMYDRQTESWWQQINGEAVVGEYTGRRLEFLPAAIVSWADFVRAFPDGKVLSRQTGYLRNYGENPYVGYDELGSNPFLFDGRKDGRLPAMERVVTVEVNGEAAAYPFTALADARVVMDSVGGVSIVVFFKPGTASALDRVSIAGSRDVGTGNAFRAEAGGRTLTFRADGAAFVDNETRSTWDIFGRATAGPLRGAQLEPVVSGNHFWFSWAVFKPETKVWAP